MINLRSLYIYGGSKDYKISINKRDFIYHINTGVLKTESQCLDGLESIHNIALKIKDDYIRYINSLNDLFIKNNLLFKKDISLFYFSDLFNKRTELFDTFLSICHITFIKEQLIDKYKINSIKTIQCSSSFNQSILSSMKDINIEIIKEKKEKKYLLKRLLAQKKYYLDSLLNLLLIKLFYKKEERKNTDSLFLSRYPLHFNKNFVEDKYGDMVGKNDSFLISMITDGFHQKIKLNKIYDYINDLNRKKNIIFLDYYLTASDFIWGFINSILLIKRTRRLYKKNYFFNGIKITKFISKELEQSFIRIPRLLIYGNAIKKVFSFHGIKKSIFYLHEYSYGRFFNYVLIKYFPNVIRVGFQHGPAARRKLLYYLGKNIVSDNPKDWQKKTPIPNMILAEDELSKSIYEEAGYKNVKIMKYIPRLKYLSKINRNNILDKVLIVPGLHDGYSLLTFLFNRIKEDNDNLYILKPHPRSKLFSEGVPNEFKSQNLSLGFEHISKYLESSKEVIVTYSSVGIEAHLLNIPVTVVCLPNLINESPLLDIPTEKSVNIIYKKRTY